jgi:hypothetical protein
MEEGLDFFETHRYIGKNKGHIVNTMCPLLSAMYLCVSKNHFYTPATRTSPTPEGLFTNLPVICESAAQKKGLHGGPFLFKKLAANS